MQKLASALRELRESANISRDALAEKAEVSAAFIYKLEAGAYTTLSIDKSRNIAKGLGLSFRDFLDAVGLLDDSSTPKADQVLTIALRKRKLNDGQVKQIVSFVEFIEKSSKK